MLYYFVTLEFMLVAMIIETVLIGIICGILAYQKGRSVIGWIILSLFLGLIAVIILVVLSDLSYNHSVNHSALKHIDDTPIGDLWICTSCGVENCGGGVCCNCSKARNNANKKVKIPEYQGKEWVCDYCGAHNDGKTSLCKHCNRMRGL